MSLPQENRQPRYCDYEGYDYREAFWTGEYREYEDLAERIALRRLLPSTGRRLLDIGAGFGRLADLYSGYDEIILLDAAKSLLRQARGRLQDEGITYIAGNVYQLPLADASVDVVLSVRVLHHLTEVPLAFREIRRVLRPNGLYVLEYANKRNLKAMLRFLLRHGSNPFSHEPYEFVPLNFDFHPTYVERELLAAGFTPVQQLSVSTFRLAILKRLIPARILAALDGCLQRPTAPLKLGPSVFLEAIPAAELPTRESAALLRCPLCHSTNLRRQESVLLCQGCGRAWPIEEGIYDFKTPLPQ